MKLESIFEAAPSLSAADRDLIERAYRLAERAHAGQVRASGEPYLQHSLTVAKILADFGVPATTLAAALLHDVVEDSGIPLADLRRQFGDEIANLVDGVTKLTQLPRVSRAGETTAPDDETEWRRALDVETLRKIFLAMGDDVRVVLIKLADRLHNMRTLMHLDPERRKRIAQETLEIFAPLANRLGMWQMKWELEDLAFRHISGRSHGSPKTGDRRQRMITMENIGASGSRQSGIQAEITGRPKHIYSIYRKIQRKGVPFESLHDIRGVRIIVPDLPSCYVTLGVIHNQWSPLPGEFDDYIASPKDNFYQSLHTALVYDDGKTLEVQIRTQEMHQNAELGIAAHWRYKEGGKRDESFERRILWLRSLMDWRTDVQDAAEFVDALKSDVFEDRVYVFTPKGDVIDMPAGSTPIDFAYHVHTEIGHHCRGARVNGKLVSLDYRVRTGDQVDIITTRSGGPSRDWLNTDLGLVRSQRAVSKIRQYFKRQDQEQRVAAGREVVERELRRLGVEDVSIESLARGFNFPQVNDFLTAVGSGDISSARIVTKILQDEHSELEEMPALSLPSLATTEGVNVTGLRGMLTTMARCCKPVPGDQIVGYVTRGRGATIHRTDCPNILRMGDTERLVRVSWGHAARTYPVAVRVTAYDREGLLRDVSTVVGEEHINMNSVVSTIKAHQATIELILEVTDLGQLSRVLNRVRRCPMSSKRAACAPEPPA
jgi:GTP pyrophosphokinase